MSIVFILGGDFEEPLAEMNTITFLPRAELKKCIRIVPIEDHVIEGNEFFTIQLELQTDLPAGLQDNVQLGTSRSTVTIEDTSKGSPSSLCQKKLQLSTGACTIYTLDPTTIPSVIYAYPKRTVCFSCTTCIAEMAWNLTTFRGYSWTGSSGSMLESLNFIPNRGKVLQNGTIEIFNSSVMFTTSRSGILRFRELHEPQPKSSEYEIYLGGKI